MSNRTPGGGGEGGGGGGPSRESTELTPFHAVAAGLTKVVWIEAAGRT